MSFLPPVVKLDDRLVFLFHSVTGINIFQLNFMPVKDRASQTFSSRSTLFSEWGTRFISTILFLCTEHCTMCFFRFIIQFTNNELQFFRISNSNCNLYLPAASWNQYGLISTWSPMFEHFISSFTSSSYERAVSFGKK